MKSMDKIKGIIHPKMYILSYLLNSYDFANSMKVNGSKKKQALVTIDLP